MTYQAVAVPDRYTSFDETTWAYHVVQSSQPLDIDRQRRLAEHYEDRIRYQWAERSDVDPGLLAERIHTDPAVSVRGRLAAHPLCPIDDARLRAAADGWWATIPLCWHADVDEDEGVQIAQQIPLRRMWQLRRQLHSWLDVHTLRRLAGKPRVAAALFERAFQAIGHAWCEFTSDDCLSATADLIVKHCDQIDDTLVAVYRQQLTAAAQANTATSNGFGETSRWWQLHNSDDAAVAAYLAEICAGADSGHTVDAPGAYSYATWGRSRAAHTICAVELYGTAVGDMWLRLLPSSPSALDALRAAAILEPDPRADQLIARIEDAVANPDLWEDVDIEDPF